MKITTIIAYLLAIIGAIVWLLVGLFAFLFGGNDSGKNGAYCS